MKNVDELLSLLTLEEKVALVSGHNFMYTNSVPRLDIPSVRMSDGPHGLRVQNEGGDNGVSGSSPSTCFPTASCSANTFNPSLLEKMGKAMAEEAKFYNIDIILGPGANIKRNPLCGRNFEYFSEDPLLAGLMAASEIKGIQSNGVGTSLKHFAANNSERYRFMGNSVVDMRALREIYLKQFEIAVKSSKPETIMSAYNRLNGTFCSENKWLLSDVLRDEWKYDGLVMTDWGGNNDRVLGIKAMNDLEMPGDSSICRKWLLDAVNEGRLDIKDLDKCVRNVLNLVKKHENKNKVENVDWEKHNKISEEIALEGAVLLKNESVLPLKEDEELLVVGELFEKMRYQGSGSSMINPALHITPKEAFDLHNIKYKYIRGYSEKEQTVNQRLIDEVLEGSKTYKKVILFLGLTDYIETEGDDREDMRLPENQLVLADTLIKENKDVVVVFYGGSVTELPFFDGVKGMINMFLPGQSGGEVTYKLLFGKENPSGRLAETWPLTYEDVPFGNEYRKTKQEVYKESIYVGYRYYLTAYKEVRFPFGYGLSYTEFEYNNLKVNDKKDEIEVILEVANKGDRKGKETVQVYVSSPRENVHRPLRELKGFTKVELASKETKTVKVNISKEDLRFWDVNENRFVLEDGNYIIQVGKNSRDCVLEQELTIKGEKVKPRNNEVYGNLDFSKMSDEKYESIWGVKIPELPKSRPFTLETRLDELKATFMGRILFNAVINVARKGLKEAKKMPDGTEKDNKIKGAIFLERILVSNSLRSMSMSSSGEMPYNFAEGFRDLSNGHLIKGIKDFTSKIKAPELPSDKEGK